MNENNTKTIIERCPNLYSSVEDEKTKRDNKQMYHSIAYGFECGDGWFNLILELSEKLEAIISSLPEDKRSNFKVSQVKEKFGTLRFYMFAETDEMSDLISEAEKKSGKICEKCGSESLVFSNGGWIVNMCKNCFIKHDNNVNGQIAIKSGVYWEKCKKKAESRAKAVKRLNVARAKKGLDLYDED